MLKCCLGHCVWERGVGVLEKDRGARHPEGSPGLGLVRAPTLTSWMQGFFPIAFCISGLIMTQARSQWWVCIAFFFVLGHPLVAERHFSH